MPIEIRPVTLNDSAELLEIYAPYVTETAITFEYDVPTADEFTERIRSTLEKYPYIAAVENGAGSGELIRFRRRNGRVFSRLTFADKFKKSYFIRFETDGKTVSLIRQTGSFLLKVKCRMFIIKCDGAPIFSVAGGVDCGKHGFSVAGESAPADGTVPC